MDDNAETPKPEMTVALHQECYEAIKEVQGMGRT